MKRKAIQLANQTLVISMPSKWVKEQGIKKGDDIDIEEKGKELIINSSGSNTQQKKIKLDIKGLENILHRIIGALYKAGYSEIELTYETSKELEIIQKTIKRSLTGFEIIEQSKNNVIVKEVSKLDGEEFDRVLKKCFQSLISSGQESLESFKKLDSEDMEKIALTDDLINTYCDFCRRILNTNPNIPKTTTKYFIVEQLEKIGDIYRDLCRYIAKKPFKINKDILQLYEKINEFFSDFYELYYKFDIKKIEDFAAEKKKIKEKLNECINKVAKNEIIILIYLSNLLDSIFDMNGPLLTMSL